MPQFESLGSCVHYLQGTATIKTCLPRKAAVCQYCEFIKYQSPFDRYYCPFTDEWLLNYKKERGELCPFDFK